ncbi:hypothetical protein BH23ACT9_BH23ACT9_32230 [soil metagenome]
MTATAADLAAELRTATAIADEAPRLALSWSSTGRPPSPEALPGYR